MKTITEFSGFQLSAALKKFAELSTSGKTAEECAQEMGSLYKLEGDKLKYFLAALDVAKAKPNHLKRVLVFSLNEGEKAPAGAIEKEGTHYASEFFYVPEPKKNQKREGKHFGGKGRGGKGRGKGRGGKGGGDRDRNERGRAPRGPRRDSKPSAASAEKPAPAAENKGVG
jgi:hypothetical protein